MHENSRTTYAPGETVLTTIVQPNGSYVSGWAPPGVALSNPGINSLDEVMQSSSGKDRVTFRPCFHYRKTVGTLQSYLPGMDTWHNPSNHSEGVNRYVPGNYLNRYWDTKFSGHDGGSLSGSFVFGPWGATSTRQRPIMYLDTLGVYNFVEPSDVLDVYVPMSIETMTPKIKTDAGGLAVDLIDVVSAKGAESLGRTTTNVVSTLLGLRQRGLRGVTLRELAHTVSDAYLQWQWGISPIISDVIGVVQAVKDIDRKLHWLKVNEGKRLTAHYRTVMSALYPDMDNTVTLTGLGSIWNQDSVSSRLQVTHPLRLFSATLDYRFQTDLIGGPGDRVRAFLDDIGLNINPAIIWDAIPYSFLLDFLLGIGSWLDQFKATELGIILYPIQYCYSCHVIRDLTASTGPGSNMVTAFVEHEDAYSRKVIDAKYVGGIPLKLAGGSVAIKAALLAALGITKAGRA